MTKRILIVDDDRQVLKFLVESLTKAGYDTVAFTHFEEARLYLASSRPDLILTDVRLRRLQRPAARAGARERSTGTCR